MKLTERAEEILETLGVAILEGKQESLSLGLVERDEAVSELRRAGYIQVSGERVMLTQKGREEARTIIRRHRLAERLLVDVLDMKKALTHEVGCKFEHLLHEGLDENVCTLLGHPKVCPHGKPIPPGKCCEKSGREIAQVVRSLKDLNAGDRGTVAYLVTQDERRVQKLMAMGALPGMQVRVIQKFPSYVFQVGQSQFAVDGEMAGGIFIRLDKDSRPRA